MLQSQHREGFNYRQVSANTCEVFSREIQTNWWTCAAANMQAGSENIKNNCLNGLCCPALPLKATSLLTVSPVFTPELEKRQRYKRAFITLWMGYTAVSSGVEKVLRGWSQAGVLQVERLNNYSLGKKNKNKKQLWVVMRDRNRRGGGQGVSVWRWGESKHFWINGVFFLKLRNTPKIWCRSDRDVEVEDEVDSILGQVQQRCLSLMIPAAFHTVIFIIYFCYIPPSKHTPLLHQSAPEYEPQLQRNIVIKERRPRGEVKNMYYISDKFLLLILTPAKYLKDVFYLSNRAANRGRI